MQGCPLCGAPDSWAHPPLHCKNAQLAGMRFAEHKCTTGDLRLACKSEVASGKLGAWHLTENVIEDALAALLGEREPPADEEDDAVSYEQQHMDVDIVTSWPAESVEAPSDSDEDYTPSDCAS